MDSTDPIVRVREARRRISSAHDNDNAHQDVIRMGFVPIDIEGYIALHVRRNPDERARELRARLSTRSAAKRAGRTCDCGNPLWVVGSATAGFGCFTCLTMEAASQNDFEIDDACGDA